MSLPCLSKYPNNNCAHIKLSQGHVLVLNLNEHLCKIIRALWCTLILLFFNFKLISLYVFSVQVRLLTLHLFSLFEQVHGSDTSEGIRGWPVFSLCLSAELVQPTLHDYRKKLQHLENLEFTAVHAHLLTHQEYSKVSVFCHEKMRLSKLMIS